MKTTPARWVTVCGATLALAAVAACAPPASTTPSATAGNPSGGTVSAATATSAQDLGGMEALVAAAKSEGELNVIALPPDWANYGEIIKGFETKYGIKVNSAQPDAGSADEIAAAKRLKGQATAPDVFDLGPAVAVANTDMYAPYKVADFDKIPADFKDPNGLWVNDYGGLMVVGYDSAKVPAPTSIQDLLKADYKGKVALNGDPLKAGAAFAGVQMVAISEGGSASDITKGVDFFKQLKAAGNFLPVDPTPATIESGQTPVVFDWSYNQTSIIAKVPTWKLWAPENAPLQTYYVQAINKDAPHPAAARLWQEYLYSADGQNGWLKGGATPVLMQEMITAGTIDKAAEANLPKITGKPIIPTQADTDKAKAYLTANWAAAIG